MKKRTAVLVFVMLFGALFASLTSFAEESQPLVIEAMASYETAQTQEETVKTIKATAAPVAGIAMMIREDGGLEVLEKLPAFNIKKENSEETAEAVETEASDSIEKETEESKEEVEVETEKTEETEVPSEPETQETVEEKPKWEGEVLNSFNGVVEGPSGKETYYNLPMEGVIKIMRNLGYDYEYSVREDGVKMFGPYIMCAANLELRPRGTIVETSLGTAIVCDTGDFAKYNRTQLDIAVDW